MNKKILINLFLIIAIFPIFSYGVRHKQIPNKVSDGLPMKVTPPRMKLNTHLGVSDKITKLDTKIVLKNNFQKAVQKIETSGNLPDFQALFGNSKRTFQDSNYVYNDKRTFIVNNILDLVSTEKDGKIRLSDKEFFKKFSTNKSDTKSILISKTVNATASMDPSSKKQIKFTVFDRNNKQVMYVISSKTGKFIRAKNQEAGKPASVLFEVFEK